MLPDRVSNPGPLTYESGALPIALRGPAYDEFINSFGIIDTQATSYENKMYYVSVLVDLHVGIT